MGTHAALPEWPPRLVAALSAADRAIGRLAGASSRGGVPERLARVLVRLEAARSSAIEGIRVPLADVLAAEIRLVPGAGNAGEIARVQGCAAALEHGFERLESLPLSLRLVKEVHAKLMDGMLSGRRAPSEFRRVQNWIGPPGAHIEHASFVPPPPAELPRLLGAWEESLHEQSLPPLVHAAIAHHEFESIHPFLDGNGRVGRIVIDLLLAQRAVLSQPLLCLSAYFDESRDEYYVRLQEARHEVGWEPWLLYFLQGIQVCSQLALDRIKRVETLLQGWAADGEYTTLKTLPQLISLLAENPFCTTKGVALRLDVAYTTAQRAIERLIEAGVMQQVGEAKRDRLFCATAILAILEEPTRLDASPDSAVR